MPVLLESLDASGLAPKSDAAVQQDLRGLARAVLEAMSGRPLVFGDVRNALGGLHADPVLRQVLSKMLALNGWRGYASSDEALKALERPLTRSSLRPSSIALAALVLTLLGAWAVQRGVTLPSFAVWWQVYITFPPTAPRCERHAFQTSRDFFDQTSPYQVIVAPTDDAAYEAAKRIEQQLETNTGLTIHVLGCLGLPPGSINAARGQVSAQTLLRHINTGYPLNLAPPAGSVGIILTSENMYSETSNWRYAFAWRFGSEFAAVSTHHLQSWAVPSVADARLRKMVMKQVGVLYFKYAQSSNRLSVMYDNVLSVSDIDLMLERF
jgi:hypothetical protein